MVSRTTTLGTFVVACPPVWWLSVVAVCGGCVWWLCVVAVYGGCVVGVQWQRYFEFIQEWVDK